GSDDEGQFLRFTAGDYAAAYSIILAPIGGLIGLVVGAQKVEVYRFRPDTPQQMSVVIGVRPPNVGPASRYTRR
ncbi:MAG: hypothetical protein HKN13_13250, partial [Rhodothermales bacterium]|nr:hypothetical protein [Rhodothermales bacterium]